MLSPPSLRNRCSSVWPMPKNRLPVSSIVSSSLVVASRHPTYNRGCVYTLLVCTVGSGWLHSPRRGLREIVPCVVHVARVARAPVSAQVVSGASLAKSQNRNADAARNRQRCHPLPLHPSRISLDPPPSLCTTALSRVSCANVLCTAHVYVPFGAGGQLRAVSCGSQLLLVIEIRS